MSRKLFATGKRLARRPRCATCNDTGTVTRDVTRTVYRFGIEFEEDVPQTFDCPDCDSGLFDAMAGLNRHEAALVAGGWTFADGENGLREFRAPDQKCPECGAMVTFLTREQCADCRAKLEARGRLESYGVADGRCLECGEPIGPAGSGHDRDCVVPS